MAKIIRAGWVEDAKTYVPRIIQTAELNTTIDFVRATAGFVDGLKKGWHVSSISEDENGNVVIDVAKRD